jgi:hypothetical protein
MSGAPTKAPTSGTDLSSAREETSRCIAPSMRHVMYSTVGTCGTVL